MSSNIRTILIIVVFALVTIWLFYDPRRPATPAPAPAASTVAQAEQAPAQEQSCMADKRCGCNANANTNNSDSSSIESYDSIEGFDSEASNEASIDSSDMIEGYHNLSGSVLEIEPTQSANSRGVSYFPYKRINRMSGNASFQIPDHTDAQRAGYEARMHLKARMQAENGSPADMPSSAQAQSMYVDAGQTIRNVVPATSMSNAMYTGDRVFDSNNINGECTGVYTNEIYAMSAGANADVDESEKSGEIQPPHMPTYIEIDESAGNYNTEGTAQNIDFADLNNTVRKYRSAAMADILNGKETDGSIRAENKFYDKYN